MNLRECLIWWAQNNEMIDTHYTEHGADCMAAADLLAENERLRAALATLVIGCERAGHSAGISWALKQANDALGVVHAPR